MFFCVYVHDSVMLRSLVDRLFIDNSTLTVGLLLIPATEDKRNTIPNTRQVQLDVAWRKLNLSLNFFQFHLVQIAYNILHHTVSMSLHYLRKLEKSKFGENYMHCAFETLYILLTLTQKNLN